MRPQDGSTYLHPNQSSVLMNYQTGLNNSVTTHDKSYNHHQQQPPYATVGNQALMQN